MKTKIGKSVLKVNTARMSELNNKLSEMAEELQSLKFRPGLPKTPDLERLLDYFRVNRMEHSQLQREIDTIIRLESFLPEK